MNKRTGKIQTTVHQMFFSFVFCAVFLVALGITSERVQATAVATPPVKDVVIVNTSNVNVYVLPSLNSASYGKVKQNTFLARYEMRADGWSYIDYAGTPAYIMTQFLVPYNATAAPQTVTPGTAAPAAAGIAALPALPATASTPTIATVPKASGGMVWIPNSGKKYHSRPNCSKMRNPSQVTLEQAISMGYEPCKVCH